MKIVKFKDGTYGIRRWRFIYQYLSLKRDFWWSLKYVNEWCKGTFEQCKERMNRKKDYGEVVKE